MNKHLAVITAALTLLVPAASANAANVKSKVRFGATAYAVSEDAGSATLSVTRSARNGKSKAANLNSIVTVGYSTSNGTAVAGVDYTAASGRLTFPACGPSPAAGDGCLVQKITVPVLDDSAIDGNKTIRVALTSPSRNAVVVNPQKTILTIADNEGPDRLTFDAADYHVWELGPQVEMHVIRAGAGISDSSTVDFATADGTATAPSDYTAKATTLAFAPGEVDKTVAVDITDNSAVEPNETFSVGLANPSPAAAIDAPTAPVTILDDDTPVNARIGFDQASYSVGEGGDVTVTVNRSAGIDSAVSVDYATVAQSAGADFDYTAVADTLDFDPGDTSQSFTVSTVGDSLHEGDETFGLTLGSAIPSGTVIDTGSTTVTIADDDPVPAIGLGSTSSGNGSVTFVVELSNPTTTPVTADYVITDANGNQVGTGTATVPAGSTTATVEVPVGGTGPYTVTLSSPVGGTIDPTRASSTTPVLGGGTPGQETSTGDHASNDQPALLLDGQAPTVLAVPGALRGNETLLDAKLGSCRLRVTVANRIDRRRGLVVKLRAARDCTATIGASVKGKGKSSTASAKLVRALKAKRQTVRLRAGKTTVLKLRFTKRALGLIKRALDARRPMTLTLVVIERESTNRVSKRTFRTNLRR